MNNNQHLKNPVLSFACDATTATHDVSEEFVLPDYVNEVRRVLFTRAQVLPESKYVSDSQGGTMLDFGGTVTYSVIYVDDEGKLCSTPLCSSYETSVMLKSKPHTIFIDTVCDNVTTRVSAPRRLTIKARLKSRILGVEDKEISEGISGKSSADELFIERLSKSVSTFSVVSGMLSGIKISEKLDTGSKKDIRVVLCDASIVLKEIKATNGGASCQGEVIVKCVCESEGELFTLSKCLPIYECVELEGACPSDTIRAVARCVSLSIFNEEQNDQSELCFDVCCEIEAEAYRNEENALVLDCYSTKNEMSVSYRECELFTLASGACESFSINESIKRRGKDAKEIVDIMLDPVFERCDINAESATLIGRLCVSVIGRGLPQENGECEYYFESYEIALKHELPLLSRSSSGLARTSFGISLTDATLSDDKLHISAQIYPSACVLERSAVQIVDGATINRDTEYKNDASCVRVYFPREDDTLWEIAKRYHTTTRRLSEENQLSDPSLDGVKSIII